MEAFYRNLGDFLVLGKATSVRDLEDMCELSTDDRLGNLLRIQEILDSYGLEISPPLLQGDFDQIRFLSSKASTVDIHTLISNGESQRLEFKSTAFCNLDKKTHNPGLSPYEFFDEGVLLSTLKTIAAFANTEGGELLIGVNDNGDIISLKEDFQTLGIVDKDKWELRLRQEIENRFYEGKSLNSFVRLKYSDSEYGLIAIAEIGKRPALDFLKKGANYHLYVRQGNRTVSVGLQEIEEYFEVNRTN